MGFAIGVIGDIISGVSVWFLTTSDWATNQINFLWINLKEFITHLKSVAMLEVHIPIWICTFLLVAFIFYIKNSKKSSLVSHEEITSPAPQENTKIFSENEILIIKTLAKADGQYMKLGEISILLNKPKLIIEQAIDSLDSKDYLYSSLNMLHGTSYRLSDKGRDYAISNGYIE